MLYESVGQRYSQVEKPRMLLIFLDKCHYTVLSLLRNNIQIAGILTIDLTSMTLGNTVIYYCSV